MAAAIAGTTRRMSTPARAPIANAASVQAANAIPVSWKYWGGERAVPGGEERVVEPAEQLAERRGSGGDRHGGQREAGERPPGPPGALGPGEPEGAGLQLPGQDRRSGEHPGQHRNGVQHERADLGGGGVAGVEKVERVLTVRPAGRRGAG